MLTKGELLATVTNSLPLAVLVIDDLGKLVFFNAEAQTLFFEGRPSEGQNFLQLLGTAALILNRMACCEPDCHSVMDA